MNQKKQLSRGPRNLDIATLKEVLQLVEYHIHEGAVLVFCGLLRFDDLSHMLVYTDLLHIYRDHMEIFLFKSKTDQHCKGAFVTIGRIGGPCCPVLLLEQLLEAGHYQRTPCTSVWRDGVEADAEDVGPLLHTVKVRRNCLEEVVAALPSTVEAMPYYKFHDTLWTLCVEAAELKFRTSLGTPQLIEATAANGADADADCGGGGACGC
ncbi:hypothetical protein VOLCADRAFT_90495 [Volvox carteri f. nagariensis]|uniref:Uncharacterized protein n=1 Tax=Volvox carteri f. nagariensis TaxID=3068 RepID=D8TUJ2_VOLCA|nr:uncharacterized protein VOLCADRAFT_90495 [Volvox carteri f. nagariensis]EFJ48832.1 hypothetical protein VOLCADRAFT_90495 [Volvox carteri f. nagariensis]|eukprot:XP_002950164.1 hypothetical protein VOLCADRAFT_90495 [Volvox carteri f. nagariensis]